jgi:hypothetical protein
MERAPQSRQVVGRIQGRGKFGPGFELRFCHGRGFQPARAAATVPQRLQVRAAMSE